MYKVQEHEDVINNLSKYLNVEGVDQAQVSLLIQNLRANYSEVDETVSKSSKDIEGFKELNEGLRSANMQLLSQLGVQNLNTNKEQLMNEKNNSKQHQEQQEQQEQPMSLDEVTNSFL